MKCINANSLFLQAGLTLSDVDAIVATGTNPSTQSYLAKHLTVYLAGIYEQSIEEIIWEYAASTGSKEIENFVLNQLDKNFRNPDMGNIITIVKQFSTSWADTLKALDNRYKDAITSIVNNKNLIAHGQPSLVTVTDVKDYHVDATVVVETIDNIFLGV